MSRPARKAEQRSRGGRGQFFETPEPSRLDGHLTQILVSVAALLLRNGYGFRRFNKLARVAFVDAAVSMNPNFGTRTSIARIAAITGLTRVEISQLLRSKTKQSANVLAPTNRVIQVATGWSSDAAYLDRSRKPRLLPFASGRASFTKLVKKYSGDIPARAMLTEMKRHRMVKEHPKGDLQLVRRTIRAAKSTIAALRAISPWVNFFGKIGNDTEQEELTSTARQVKLRFDSLPQVYAALRELEGRRASFVAGIELLGMRRTQDAKFELTVSVAVAAAKPLPAKSSRR